MGRSGITISSCGGPGRTRRELGALNGVTKTYTWVMANLLSGVNSSDPNDTDTQYWYTGDLKRVWRFEDGELKNTYKWDAGFNVVQETYWSGGSATMTKAYAGGLAEVDVTSTPSYSYPTWDHLGSTRGMWDGSIGQLGSWEYTPYGSPYLFAGPNDVTQLFTGHDLDPVTGKYYAPFRYLDPAAGRWLKQDPLGMIDGPNMYGYVNGNPISSTDTYGLSGGRGSKEWCDKWKNKIDNYEREVKKRYDELREDRRNLRDRDDHPSLPDRESRRGHWKMYNRAKAALAAARALHDAYCSDDNDNLPPVTPNRKPPVFRTPVPICFTCFLFLPPPIEPCPTTA